MATGSQKIWPCSSHASVNFMIPMANRSGQNRVRRIYCRRKLCRSFFFFFLPFFSSSTLFYFCYAFILIVLIQCVSIAEVELMRMRIIWLVTKNLIRPCVTHFLYIVRLLRMFLRSFVVIFNGVSYKRIYNLHMRIMLA